MKASSTPNNSRPTARPPKININRNVYTKGTPPRSAQSTPRSALASNKYIRQT